MGEEDESQTTAELAGAARTPEEVVQRYNDMEDSLLKQLKDALAQSRPMKEIANIVDAVGHIRSRKAIPLLTVIIDRHREETARPETVAQPVAIVLDPSVLRITWARTLFTTDAYPALGALVRIGVPLDLVLSEIEKAEGGSNRERLLVRLGVECHGEAFHAGVRARAAAETGPAAEKWGRLAVMSATQ